MTRTLRALAVLTVLVATSAGLVGTAQAATAFNGKRCTIVGSARADIIHGTAGNDVICGLGGDDHLYGMGGNDVIDGGTGWDWMWGGSGTDVLHGGTDYDTAWYDDHRTPVRAWLDGTARSGTGTEHDTLQRDVENVIGGSGDDQLFGNSGRNVIDGGPGDDLIDAGSGPDQVFGGTGVDEVTYQTRKARVSVVLDNRAYDGQRGEGDNVYDDVEIVVGTAYNDNLVGSTYPDALYGLGGNDGLTGLGGSDYLSGGSGTDTALYEDHHGPTEVSLDGVANDGSPGEHDNALTDIENVRGGSGNDVLRGNATMNGLQGMAGNDILYGNGAHDALDGGDGNDHLEGGTGDDTLRGGRGDDLIVGGDGKDLTWGDPGADRVFGGNGDDYLLLGGEDRQPDHVDGGAGVNVCETSYYYVNDLTSCQVTGSSIDEVHPYVPYVYGHLTDSTGAPVEGAALGLNGTYVTNAAGEFGYLLDAYENSSTYGGVHVRLPAVPGRGELVLGNGEVFAQTTVIDLQLPAPHHVTVKVVDTDGNPVSGAHVDLLGSFDVSLSLSPDRKPFTGYQNPPAQGTTDAAGEYSYWTFRAQTDGLRVAVQDATAGPVSKDVAAVDATTDPTVTVVLDLTPAHVTGTLTDADGSPVVAAGLKDYVNGAYFGATSTDASGAFALTVPRAAGGLVFAVPAHGAYPALAMYTGWQPVDGGSLSLVLPALTQSQVHVKDLAGNAVVGAVVTPQQSQASSPISLGADLPAMTPVFTLAPQTTDGNGDLLFATYPTTVNVTVTVPTDTGTRQVTRSLALGSSPVVITV